MLDHEVMGVGGDNSWEPCVHEKYLVRLSLSPTSHSHVTHTPHTKVQSGKTYTWGVSVIPMRSEKAVKKKKRKRSGKSKVSNKKKHSRVETTNDDEAMAMRREALRVRNEGLL